MGLIATISSVIQLINKLMVLGEWLKDERNKKLASDLALAFSDLERSTTPEEKRDVAKRLAQSIANS